MTITCISASYRAFQISLIKSTGFVDNWEMEKKTLTNSGRGNSRKLPLPLPPSIRLQSRHHKQLQVGRISYLHHTNIRPRAEVASKILFCGVLGHFLWLGIPTLLFRWNANLLQQLASAHYPLDVHSFSPLDKEFLR